MCPIHRRLVRECSVKAAREFNTHSLIRSDLPTARIMLFLFAITLAVAAAAPSYDQRQDGEFNVQADVQNIVLLVALPSKIPSSFLDLLMRSSTRSNEPIAQDRADVQFMEAFVEPSTPYQVEIGPESERSAGGETKSAEVVIASRKHIEPEPESHEDEMKLIGATEQCGPDRQRDPVTLMCRFRINSEPEKSPEVILATS